MRWLFWACGLATIGILLAIFGLLAWNGSKAFATISWSNFWSAEWNPDAYGEASFGVGNLLLSTFLVTLGAMVLAIPLGLGTAAYLSEFASPRIRNWLKPIIELLAAIPSVVIGFFGIVVIGPLIARVFGLSNGLNALNGAILLAVMSLPTIITVAEDAISAVPRSFREGSYALGANRWQTLVRVTIPAAFSGVVAAIILGIGRALGETMTVLMVTGNATGAPSGFFSSVRTITATIAIELGEVPFDTPHYYALFALGALLFIISLAVNILAEWIATRYRY